MDAFVWKQLWKASVCYKTSRDKEYARDNERKGHEDRRREKEGTRQEKSKRERKSNARLLLILPYLSLFAETPFVFQVPVIRA